MKSALIVGITGQTGAFLSRELLSHGYSVVGTSRDWSESNLWRLRQLGLRDDVELLSLSLHDYAAIDQLLESRAPDEIYYLAGPSSVAASFREPSTSMDQIYQPVLSFLEVLRKSESRSSFVNAASTDCFGNQPGITLDEHSPLMPVSPYGTAKTAAYWATKNYREGFQLRAANAILTNHESPLRGPEFVTQKIVSGLRAVKEKTQTHIALGNTQIVRDWLWAGDVARALHLMGSSAATEDFVVGSGTSSTLMDFTQRVCDKLGLDSDEVVRHHETLHRPQEIMSIHLNPTKIRSTLGWEPSLGLEGIVDRLIARDISP